MMITRTAALSALLLLPTIAAAQRTNRGQALYGDWNRPDTAMGRAAPSFKKSDIEKFSAVLLLVDKKKALKLSDEQVAKFKDLGKAEEGYNEPLYVKMDSLRLALRRRPGEEDDTEKARMTVVRQELMGVIEKIRSNYDSTFNTSCVPLLDETQKTASATLIAKARAEAEEDLRSKFGGGGRRRP